MSQQLAVGFRIFRFESFRVQVTFGAAQTLSGGNLANADQSHDLCIFAENVSVIHDFLQACPLNAMLEKILDAICASVKSSSLMNTWMGAALSTPRAVAIVGDVTKWLTT